MKFFNTAGPVNQPEHYKIDPLHRWDLDEVLTLIAQRKYFIVHAPRQTGKTSSLLALRDYLNAEGNYLCVYANFEVAQAARHDVAGAMHALIGQVAEGVQGLLSSLPGYDPERWKRMPAEHAGYRLLEAFLTYVAESSPRPFVLLIDEIDALIGDTLVSVLRQIRSGYSKRPASFPSSIVLCGVRDIQDYRIHRANEEIITGGSAFNIKAKSLRLGNFTPAEIHALYGQHTEETGQGFAEECFELVWRYTGGQPWLVNALAHEVTYEMKENRDPAVTITAELLAEAKERLILSRQTHLDQLADKLSEDRVRRVILPMLTGEEARVEADDTDYCIDLGLIQRTDRGVAIANEIYREVIPRELSKEQQDNLAARFAPEWVAADGRIDTGVMLTLFREFWRENADIWASHIKGYQEAAPQLVTQAFLQRVVNGQGYIGREYAVGRGRTDLLIKWRYAAGKTSGATSGPASGVASGSASGVASGMGSGSAPATAPGAAPGAGAASGSGSAPATASGSAFAPGSGPAAFPSGSAPTGPVRWQKIVLELKVIGATQSYATVKAQALAQTAAYVLACNAEEAHILIFDRDETRGWRDKVFDDEGEHGGVRMRIWGL